MLLHRAIFGGLALVLTGVLSSVGPAPVFAAGPSAPKVDAADRRWRQARARLRETRADQRDLEKEIAALKRRDAQNQTTSPELQRLLVQSVAAEKRLSALRTKETESREELRTLIRDRIRALDRETRAFVPRLKTGPLTERQAAARHIKDLRELRQRLRARLSRLSTPRSGSKKSWSRYEVSIEPLDGPRELNEKADFVEDTRDKLAKKRQALAALIRRARQEREVARAALDFTRDVRAFDEESRGTRVARPSSGTTRAAGDEGTPTENTGDPAAPPQFDSGGAGREDVPAPPPTTPSPAVPAPTVPDVPREISPDVLVNLRVDSLADNPNVDLDTLRRLEQEFSELDAFLKARATKIRGRAQELERTEGAGRR